MLTSLATEPEISKWASASRLPERALTLELSQESLPRAGGKKESFEVLRQAGSCPAL